MGFLIRIASAAGLILQPWRRCEPLDPFCSIGDVATSKLVRKNTDGVQTAFHKEMRNAEILICPDSAASTVGLVHSQISAREGKSVKEHATTGPHKRQLLSGLRDKIVRHSFVRSLLADSK
jgi:hypothetical protein